MEEQLIPLSLPDGVMEVWEKSLFYDAKVVPGKNVGIIRLKDGSVHQINRYFQHVYSNHILFAFVMKAKSSPNGIFRPLTLTQLCEGAIESFDLVVTDEIVPRYKLARKIFWREFINYLLRYITRPRSRATNSSQFNAAKSFFQDFAEEIKEDRREELVDYLFDEIDGMVRCGRILRYRLSDAYRDGGRNDNDWYIPTVSTFKIAT